MLWFMRDVLMNGPQTPGILARRIAPPALMMALGPVLTTKPDQHDNRVKDRQTDKDFRCRHRALTGQRGPTDQDLSGLLYVAQRMAMSLSAYLAPRCRLPSRDH